MFVDFTGLLEPGVKKALGELCSLGDLNREQEDVCCVHE
jgi:hypothetical protein